MPGAAGRGSSWSRARIGWDAGLEAFSTGSTEDARLVWRYLVEGGEENCRRVLGFLDHLLGRGERPPPPLVLAHAGCYWPGVGEIGKDELVQRLVPGRPAAAIVFYRALVLGNSTAPIDALIAELADAGLDALPVFVTSLKDRQSAEFLDDIFAAVPPAIVLNTTSFAVSGLGATHSGTVLDRPGRPVLQVVLAGSSEEAWQESTRGFGPRDLTMNVVLPEVDGRVLTRAVSFKADMPLDAQGGSRGTTYRPVADRVRFVVAQAAAWVRLANKPAKDRRIAIVLSNYPDRDGRLANGVGLDTPESAARIGAALREGGYEVSGFPASGADLMTRLLAGPTNAKAGVGGERLSLADYRRFFDTLPEPVRASLTARWGAPEDDPFFERGAFRLAVHRFGNVVVGIQPARGYGVDPKATYHDPDLVPPHHYLAFYAWLRTAFDADAIVHLGKHGNLEWLPGKALGLSETCWPEVALGATPLVYPFIVNDPGEGSQAKRRASAVIVDHLMPAMTRAEIHGPLAELETLIDEYYVAAGVDKRRRDYLAGESAGACRAARARPRSRIFERGRRRGAPRPRRAPLRTEGNADPRRTAHPRRVPRWAANASTRWWQSRACRAPAAVPRMPRCTGRSPMTLVSASIRSTATRRRTGAGQDQTNWRACPMCRGAAPAIRWSGSRRWRLTSLRASAKLRSSPRRRPGSRQLRSVWGNREWIPAFAGMTTEELDRIGRIPAPFWTGSVAISRRRSTGQGMMRSPQS